MSERRLAISPRAWALIVGLWLTWGLLWSMQAVVQARLRGDALTAGSALLLQMPLALAWIAVTPGILWLGRRWPLEGPRWPAHLLLHAGASVLVLFVLGTFYQAVVGWVRGVTDATLLARSVRTFGFWFLSDSLLYWAVIFIDYGVRQYARARQRELHASQLETQLAQARLTALKTQLQPHFLFNALHTIGALVRTGQNSLAVRVVAGLGDLLRAMLDEAATQEVPLRQELTFLRSYLDIEQIRFSDRLQVVFAIDDDAIDARVPHLILQPLVENALRHGIAPTAAGGRLIVSARRIDGQLLLAVRDDGQGLAVESSRVARLGVGLANVRNRLHQLFGSESDLVVEPALSGGTEARITLPYRPAPPEHGEP
jgi:hypothetical protein